MTYEVETKFRVDDLRTTERALLGLGAQIGEPRVEVDAYLQHPARDFSRTDEALRLRQVGDTNTVTYKGPKVDATTKTRLELELELPRGPDPAARFLELMQRLGFTRSVVVRKERRKSIVDWGGGAVEVALDAVEELGPFVELEAAAEESGLDGARRRLAALAERLGLTRSERRSYLELLVARRARGTGPPSTG